MTKPGEYKSVQSRIIQYAVDIGWSYVPRNEAEMRRGLSDIDDIEKKSSLILKDSFFKKIKEFNSNYKDNPDELLARFERLKSNIYGNREMLQYLRAEQKFYYKEEDRELNLIIIDYNNPDNNIYEVSEEFYFSNGRYSDREDIVFFINGIPVLFFECKNADKEEAIEIGIDQIRRYHNEIPELLTIEQIFSVTESIGFSYGVTWNTINRNIFKWKDEEIGNLEKKVKTFCNKKNVLSFLKDFIIFAEKDEELNKYILRQHQKIAVQKVLERALDTHKTRGLIWHTQGSGKTFTMIKIAELLFKAPKADKPTILLMIDRNELEDQMLKNLNMLGLNNVEHAINIKTINKLLKSDYRGIIVTMIHKFRDMPANINMRTNIFILIDEAHRTTQGDLGNYLMAGLPNAKYIGFTGTPVDKTVYGKGTFKTFGIDDNKGYLHKYSIAESIEDKTTLPLFYAVAQNELLVPKDILEKEFYALSEQFGITDIEELNKILDRAVNTKNFIKGKERIDKVAKYVSEHYLENVEPLGYKAFMVAVDREACAFYKEALDKYLPKEYSEVVYTGNNNDSELLKKYHIDRSKEKEIRKNFTKYEKLPKILIVTEKLLTGYDAPILYAMYLDKPMKDHTLLQAIARVNRPYENEEQEMIKPHGFILDFVGIFENLSKALAFDSEEVNAIVKDIKLLKMLFKEKMEIKIPEYIKLIKHNFNDKDIDYLIEYFRDKERRKELFKEYKELEMIYEIISPDKFLSPYLNDYGTISAIFSIVRKAYTKRISIDKEFQRKTNELIQSKINIENLTPINKFIEINKETIEKIKKSQENDNVKVINLIKSIEQIAIDNSNDPNLITLTDRALAIQENYENRQESTKEALNKLINLMEQDIERKKDQNQKGLDGLTYFIYRTLLDKNINGAEGLSKKIKPFFDEYPNWLKSERELRELRNKITFSICTQEDDLDKVTNIVESLFNLLMKASII